MYCNIPMSTQTHVHQYCIYVSILTVMNMMNGLVSAAVKSFGRYTSSLQLRARHGVPFFVFKRKVLLETQ